MTLQCELIDHPAQITLAIRTHSAVQDLAKVLPRCYMTIGDYLTEIGQKPGGPPFVAYYNMDMQNLDIEAGVPTSKKLPGKGEIQPSTLPAEKAAACVYVGPYDGLPIAYDALSNWMKAQGIEAKGTAYEVYLNDPAEVPPEALQTQIVMPVKVS